MRRSRAPTLAPGALPVSTTTIASSGSMLGLLNWGISGAVATEPKQLGSKRERTSLPDPRSQPWNCGCPSEIRFHASEERNLAGAVTRFVFFTIASKSAVPCGRQRAQSCPRRILLRARPCDDPGFVPGNRARPSARSAELQAIHRMPLQNPRSPLLKAPPNPTWGASSYAADGASHSSYESPFPESVPERFR